MKKLAHRGYSAKYPENTMEAFIQAYSKGFDGVETDVHMSKDGELVLIHDEMIDRTSQGHGYVKDYTLKELKTFNFNNSHEGHFEIPTLKELLTFIQDKDFEVNIEIKTDCIHYSGIEEKVYDLVLKMGVKDKVIYSSFYLPSVLKMKVLDPQAYVGYLLEKDYDKKYQELLKHHIDAFHPKYTFVNHTRMKKLKENHIIVAVWTVLNFKEYQRLKDLGVDIIISNEYFK